MDGINGLSGRSFSLDLLKNNSHSVDAESPGNDCTIGFLQGAYKVEGQKYRAVNTNLRCNKWSCHICNPIKKKALKRRCYYGGITEFAKKKGFRDSPYAFKMLTLTCPGKDFRNRHSPAGALRLMNESFEKFRKALKKKWGKFNFFKVTEPHEDGFPHFHILIVGHAIAPKEILDHIRSL